jgi:hypothetical protein
MTFSDFFKIYQDLMVGVSRKSTTEKELDFFLDRISIAIEAYAEIESSLKYQTRKWNQLCRHLCDFRDGITKARKELENDSQK